MSDDIIDDIMRQEYRPLSDRDKKSMRAIKDAGLTLHSLITGLGESPELLLARMKVEEAVMWAAKHITAS